MNRLRFTAAALGLVLLLSGCGNRDTGKNDELMPVPENERERPQPKKDADKKHSHEPG